MVTIFSICKFPHTNYVFHILQELGAERMPTYIS